MSQKLSLLARLRFQILGEQVRIHLCLQQGDTRPVGLVNVLGRLGVELEGGEDDDPSDCGLSVSASCRAWFT